MPKMRVEMKEGCEKDEQEKCQQLMAIYDDVSLFEMDP